MIPLEKGASTKTFATLFVNEGVGLSESVKKENSDENFFSRYNWMKF